MHVCHFLRRRFAVAGGLAGRVRPALQNIGDVNVRARKAGGLDDFREQLPALPTNGSPCSSSSAPGASPTNISCASMLPTPNTTIFARRSQVRTFHARQRAFSQRGKGDGLSNFGFRISDFGLNQRRNFWRRRRLWNLSGGLSGENFGRLREFAERLRRDGDMPNAARFQIFQMLNRRVEQLAVSIGHGARITCHAAVALDFSGLHAPLFSSVEPESGCLGQCCKGQPKFALARETLPSVACYIRSLSYFIALDLWN